MKDLSIGKDVISDRLLTDERMAAIWGELRRWPFVSGDKLAPAVLLRTYGIPDETVSRQDQAIAALFAFAVIEFSKGRSHGLGSGFWMLTAAMHTIYGERIPPGAATMTAVALGISPVTEATADNWCKDLLPTCWVRG